MTTPDDSGSATAPRPRRRLRIVLAAAAAVIAVVAVVAAVVLSQRAGEEDEVRQAFSEYVDALATSDCEALERLHPVTTDEECEALADDMDADERRQLAATYEAFEVTAVDVDGDAATLQYTADLEQFGGVSERGTVTLLRVDDEWTIDQLG